MESDLFTLVVGFKHFAYRNASFHLITLLSESSFPSPGLCKVHLYTLVTELCVQHGHKPSLSLVSLTRLLEIRNTRQRTDKKQVTGTYVNAQSVRFSEERQTLPTEVLSKRERTRALLQPLAPKWTENGAPHEKRKRVTPERRPRPFSLFYLLHTAISPTDVKAWEEAEAEERLYLLV